MGDEVQGLGVGTLLAPGGTTGCAAAARLDS